MIPQLKILSEECFDSALIEEPAKSGTSLKKIIREPLFHFFLLGALIYAVSYFINERAASNREQIQVDKTLVAKLEENWKKEYGEAPNKAQINSLVDNYIRQEVLYREGLKLGLDKEDEMIRRRVAQKMEFLQQDLKPVTPPSDQNLKDLLAKNSSKYLVPAKYSFTHVYFSPDNGNDKTPLERAKRVLTSLRLQNLKRAPYLGDRFPFAYDYSQLSQGDVRQIFGVSPLAESLPAAPESEWTGPIKSGYGYHLVFVSAKLKPHLPQFSTIKAKLTEDYYIAESEKVNVREFKKIKDSYIITGNYSLDENK